MSFYEQSVSCLAGLTAHPGVSYDFKWSQMHNKYCDVCFFGFFFWLLWYILTCIFA